MRIVVVTGSRADYGLIRPVIEAVSAFPLREHWLDIGRRASLERALADDERVFGGRGSA